MSRRYHFKCPDNSSSADYGRVIGVASGGGLRFISRGAIGSGNGTWLVAGAVRWLGGSGTGTGSTSGGGCRPGFGGSIGNGIGVAAHDTEKERSIVLAINV